MVVIGALFGVGQWLVDSGGDLLETDSSQVEVRQVVVVNGPMETRFVDGKLLQLPKSMPQLDITVRNTGKLPALLTGVRVKVEDSARLAVCEYHTGDMVPVSGKYEVTLPILPTSRERTMLHPLHQEVLEGAVDRFKVRFRLPWNGEDNYVYALRVELVSDDSAGALDVGRFVLGVPGSVNRGGRILPEGPEPFGVTNDSERLMSTWCVHRNLAALERVLSREGRRSSSMAALSDFQPAAWLPTFVDRRSPEAAIDPLLRATIGEGPVLAVFAAERAGKPGLEEQTRERAAISLLDDAADALQAGYVYSAQGAIKLARQALIFDPSSRARRLLSSAEARLPVLEAEQEEQEAEAFE